MNDEQVKPEIAPKHVCSFCSKTSQECDQIILAPIVGVCICNSCVALCVDLLLANKTKPQPTSEPILQSQAEAQVST